MILVLADDLTGALEVGALFAECGFRSIVSTKFLEDTSLEVVVIDTESRHLSTSEAYQRVAEIVRRCNWSPDLVYKKTDSTLRGNIGAELRAVSELFPNWSIGYAPAYPRQGRMVMNGILYVNDVPLDRTEFAYDALNPVTTSSVRELLHGLPCEIFDGATDSDVDDAARTILSDSKMRIASGPAALAGALARQLRPHKPIRRELPHVRTCIVLNGSRTEVAKSQMRYASEKGCVSEGGEWSAFDIHPDRPASPGEMANLRAQSVINSLAGTPREGLFVIGGDTAFAAVAALGHPPIAPITEIVPGVALSRVGDLFLITKAGAFGQADVICQVRRILNEDAG